MNPVRVEYEFHIKTTTRGRKRLVDGPTPPRQIKPDKITAAARTLALAYHFDRLIASGEAADYANLARRFGISRARVTQIMDRLLMPVGEQEKLLLHKKLLHKKLDMTS